MRTAIVSTLALVLPLAAHADELLQAVKDKTFQTPQATFNMAFVRDGQSFQAKVDPTQPVGARITILSPEESEWPEGFADTLAKMDENSEGAIWCDEFLAMVPDTAERTAQTDGLVTYTFTPLNEPGADRTERKLFEALVATLRIDPETETVSSYQMHLPEATKPSFFARIETFSMFVDCLAHESGNSHFTRFDLEVAGSAMGQDFSQIERRRISNVTVIDAATLPGN
ncbi:MAG: hypothetical protein AAGH87_01095 [Pseudomonadota bacterium]